MEISADRVTTMGRNERLLLTVSILTALFLGEAVARWLIPQRYQLHQSHHLGFQRTRIQVYDPEIGWVLTNEAVRSNEDASPSRPDLAYSIRNGERITSSQPKSGPIIVTTGCSFTFGQFVTDNESWPWLLQQRLPDYHVVNVGDLAYGTDQALLAADRATMRYPGQVRTVVLGFADFQIHRNRCGQTWLAKIQPFSKPLFVQTGDGAEYKRQMKFWSLGSFANTVIDHSALLSRAANVIADDLVYRVASHNAARQLTIGLVMEFARRFKSRGIRLVVAVLPWNDDQLPQSKRDRHIVMEQLRAANIPTMEPDFPRLPNGVLNHKVFLIVGHPTGHYNSLLAAQLARFLEELNAAEGR